MFNGKYLFHVHTSHTDGKLKVQDYFDFAEKGGYEKIIFLEHIRHDLDYDVGRFSQEIAECSDKYGILGILGFETKILPDGRLDIRSNHLEIAQVIGVAEHGFPDDINILTHAFYNVIAAATQLLPSTHVVWVHPGLWFKKRNLLDKNLSLYKDMLMHAQDHGIKIEHNLRYKLIPPMLIDWIDPQQLVIGQDAHSLADLPTDD